MYSNKTLIGNWFADRGNTLAPTVLAEIPSIVYPEVYNCKAFPEIPSDDELIELLDFDVDKQPKKVVFLRKDVPEVANFFDNFSSSYDLSYNYFPKCYKRNIPRLLECGQEFHQPSSEYLPNFGNITKSGVMDDKMREWDLDKESTRHIYSSAYKQDFKAPKAADYVFKRYVTQSHNSHQ
ncbi:unnamed protein product [Tenebrio molitor]|nr:unnamed protein product [Tenebrio molitor]